MTLHKYSPIAFQLILSNEYYANTKHKQWEPGMTEVEERSKRSENVLNWASYFVAEDEFKSKDYLWPHEMLKLQEDLKFGRTVSKIAIAGLQGAGKTRAFLELSRALQSAAPEGYEPYSQAISFKWPIDGNWYDAIIPPHDSSNSLHLKVANDLVYEFVNLLRINRQRLLKQIQQMGEPEYARTAVYLAKDENWDEGVYQGEAYLRAIPLDLAERFLPKSKIKQIRKNTLLSELQETSTVLIDLPDYKHNDRRVLERHLNEIQKFWSEVGGRPTLIFFVQKELLPIDHFFLGKCITVELKPFTPEQLVEAYKKNFKDAYPFTDEALLELAKISRGVWRRYKKYIYRCLRRQSERQAGLPISLDFVRETITFEDILEDMKLQLARIFPKNEHQLLAVRILEHARINPNFMQKELAEALQINEMMLSRILSTLEENRYIHRETGEHGEKRTKLLLTSTGRDIADGLKHTKRGRTCNVH
jgi:DNA-binding MarR family transcriptional regulator